MKFLTISDTHVRDSSTSDRGWSLLWEAKRLVEQVRPEVVLFGGDLVEPNTDMLHAAIKRLASFNVPVLWVVGNNDLEAFETRRLSEYEVVAQQWVRDTNIHILDAAPFIYKGVAFVGNYVGYDGSLYHDPLSPRAGELRQQLEGIHVREGLDTLPLDLFEKCFARLKRDLRLLPPEMPKVVCTHTVPDRRFLRYGQSQKYDDYNYTMGWDDTFIGTVPGLRHQLCGHTHRSQEIPRDGLPPIINISGGEQPRMFSV